MRTPDQMTKTLRRAIAVAPPADDHGGEDGRGAVQEDEQAEVGRRVVGLEAEAVGEEVVEVVEGDPVAEVDQQPGQPRPGEVGVLARRHPEGAHHRPRVEGRQHVVARQRHVARPQRPRHGQDQQRRRGHEVALRDGPGQLGDLDAEQHPDGPGHGDQPADHAAAADRHLVGDGRGATGPGRVEGQLHEAPGQHEPHGAVGPGEQHQGGRPGDDPADDPRHPSAEARRGAVGERAPHRVAHQRDRRRR